MSKVQELQLMIRHPNNSGFQRDPITQYFIPAHFVQKLSISQDDQLILSMEGGISISEDPNFRFDFKARGTGEIKVEAADTDGKVFEDQWPLEATGLWIRNSGSRLRPGRASTLCRRLWLARFRETGRSPRPLFATCA